MGLHSVLHLFILAKIPEDTSKTLHLRSSRATLWKILISYRFGKKGSVKTHFVYNITKQVHYIHIMLLSKTIALNKYST
jgi:3'-phosphoadenosine 5'-phosphosulfate sulfotransferase (PAPS reductase)/FAD synthetase